jgi:outer membrane protein, multidrug efflux system
MIRINKVLLLISAFSLIIFAGCKVGPNYSRPATNTGSMYRFANSTDTNSIADLDWVSLFRDTVLQRLVKTGLENNYDMKIAYERINAARASFKIARGEQWPVFSGNANAVVGTQQVYNQPPMENPTYNASIGVSWEIDLWGKLRRSKEAARANLLAEEAYQTSVRLNLIADIIVNYFDLLELDNELSITNENIRIRQEALQLVKYKLLAGTASGLIVAQAEAELASAMTEVPRLEMLIAQKEDALSILLGAPPQGIPRGLGMLDQIVIPEVKSPGIPSQLILRRPDIIMAEQDLIAANANIGVARANMLPTLTISGSIGAGFLPTSLLYNAIGGLVAPIFGGGKLRANVTKAQAEKQQMLYSYQQTIITSLKEVSDALIEFEKDKSIIESSQATVAATQTTFDLSNQLYNAGYASYLDVLDAQRQLFTTQISLSQAQNSRMVSVVLLYASLGGGWR